MQTMTATAMKESFDEILENIQADDEPIYVIGNEKVMVVVPEEYWKSVEETLFLSRDPRMVQKILEGINTPISECIPESEVDF